MTEPLPSKPEPRRSTRNKGTQGEGSGTASKSTPELKSPPAKRSRGKSDATSTTAAPVKPRKKTKTTATDAAEEADAMVIDKNPATTAPMKKTPGKREKKPNTQSTPEQVLEDEAPNVSPKEVTKPKRKPKRTPEQMAEARKNAADAKAAKAAQRTQSNTALAQVEAEDAIAAKRMRTQHIRHVKDLPLESDLSELSDDNEKVAKDSDEEMMGADKKSGNSKQVQKGASKDKGKDATSSGAKPVQATRRQEIEQTRDALVTKNIKQSSTARDNVPTGIDPDWKKKKFVKTKASVKPVIQEDVEKSGDDEVVSDVGGLGEDAATSTRPKFPPNAHTGHSKPTWDTVQEVVSDEAEADVKSTATLSAAAKRGAVCEMGLGTAEALIMNDSASPIRPSAPTLTVMRSRQSSNSTAGSSTPSRNHFVKHEGRTHKTTHAFNNVIIIEDSDSDVDVKPVKRKQEKKAIPAGVPSELAGRWFSQVMPLIYSRLGASTAPWEVANPAKKESKVKILQAIICHVYPHATYTVTKTCGVYATARTRWDDCRSAFGKDAIKVVSAYMRKCRDSRDIGFPGGMKLVDYVEWAQRADGPALYRYPSPADSPIDPDDPNYAKPDGIFESEFMIAVMKLFVSKTGTSTMVYGHPVAMYALAAAATERAISMWAGGLDPALSDEKVQQFSASGKWGTATAEYLEVAQGLSERRLTKLAVVLGISPPPRAPTVRTLPSRNTGLLENQRSRLLMRQRSSSPSSEQDGYPEDAHDAGGYDRDSYNENGLDRDGAGQGRK